MNQTSDGHGSSKHQLGRNSQGQGYPQHPSVRFVSPIGSDIPTAAVESESPGVGPLRGVGEHQRLRSRSAGRGIRKGIRKGIGRGSGWVTTVGHGWSFPHHYGFSPRQLRISLSQEAVGPVFASCRLEVRSCLLTCVHVSTILGCHWWQEIFHCEDFLLLVGVVAMGNGINRMLSCDRTFFLPRAFFFSCRYLLWLVLVNGSRLTVVVN